MIIIIYKTIIKAFKAIRKCIQAYYNIIYQNEISGEKKINIFF